MRRGTTRVNSRSSGICEEAVTQAQNRALNIERAAFNFSEGNLFLIARSTAFIQHPEYHSDHTAAEAAHNG